MVGSEKKETVNPITGEWERFGYKPYPRRDRVIKNAGKRSVHAFARVGKGRYSYAKSYLQVRTYLEEGCDVPVEYWLRHLKLRGRYFPAIDWAV